MPLSIEDKQWVTKEVVAQITERLETLETKLLTEFHKWAVAIDARQRSQSASLRAVDVEIEWIKDRLEKLEGKQ